MNDYLLKDFYKVLNGTNTTQKVENKRITLHFVASQEYIAVAWKYKNIYKMEAFNINNYKEDTIYDFYNMVMEMAEEIVEDLISDKEKEKIYKKQTKEIRKSLKLYETGLSSLSVEMKLFDIIDEKIKENE